MTSSDDRAATWIWALAASAAIAAGLAVAGEADRRCAVYQTATQTVVSPIYDAVEEPEAFVEWAEERGISAQVGDLFPADAPECAEAPEEEPNGSRN